MGKRIARRKRASQARQRRQPSSKAKPATPADFETSLAGRIPHERRAALRAVEREWSERFPGENLWQYVQDHLIVTPEMAPAESLGRAMAADVLRRRELVAKMIAKWTVDPPIHGIRTRLRELVADPAAGESPAREYLAQVDAVGAAMHTMQIELESLARFAGRPGGTKARRYDARSRAAIALDRFVRAHGDGKADDLFVTRVLGALGWDLGRGNGRGDDRHAQAERVFARVAEYRRTRTDGSRPHG